MMQVKLPLARLCFKIQRAVPVKSMKTLSSQFKRIFSRSPSIIASAPGRINIIGEHTDYNGGYVLPAAIDRRIHFLAAPRSDDKVVLWAENFRERNEFSLRNLETSHRSSWADYVKGIFWVLDRDGHDLKGIEGFIFGDIPPSSGLSSSAALEVSTAFALNSLFQLSIPAEKIPIIAQRAENEFVGVECGLMDQFISVFGLQGKAVFLDCASLDYEYVPLSPAKKGYRILVVDSRVRRELAASEYNRRREECRRVIKILNRDDIASIRDIPSVLLEEKRNELGETLFRRARHVITENERVIESKLALEKSDYFQLGELMFRSHLSLRDDYEVSCPELDLLYSVGRAYVGCLGARLTGAGFGGSGIALIEEGKIGGFRQEMRDAFQKMKFKTPQILELSIGDGAAIQ